MIDWRMVRGMGRWLFPLLAWLALTGCAGSTMVSDAAWRADPEAFAEKRVLIETTLEALLAEPDRYLGQHVVFRAVPGNIGFRNPSLHWGFFASPAGDQGKAGAPEPGAGDGKADDERRHLLCYERTYRVSRWLVAEVVAERAQRAGEPLRISGRLVKDDRLELDWFDYRDWHVDTDYQPPVITLPY